MRDWTVWIWRAVGIGGVLLCLAGSVHFYGAANAWERRFDEWLLARPIELDVDLSAPGSFEGLFDQTCSIAHGEVIDLRIEDARGAPVEDAGVLEGLRAVVHITDQRGDEVFSERYPAPFDFTVPTGEVPALFGVWPFREGRYLLRLDVTSGAPALAGLRQRLVARYELCGLERAPAAIAFGLSVVCLVFSVCAGVPTLFVFLPIPLAHNGHEPKAGQDEQRRVRTSGDTLAR